MACNFTDKEIQTIITQLIKEEDEKVTPTRPKDCNDENHAAKKKKRKPKPMKKPLESFSLNTDDDFLLDQENLLISPKTRCEKLMEEFIKDLFDENTSQVKKENRLEETKKKENEIEPCKFGQIIEEIIENNTSNPSVKKPTPNPTEHSSEKPLEQPVPSAEEEDDDDIKKFIERKRHKPPEEEEKLENQPAQKKKLKKVKENKELDLSLNAQCSICLEEIKDLANPNNCNHDFCKACLIHWSKDCTNTCPLCKKPFNKIYIYEKGKRKEIKVERKKMKNFEEVEIYPRDDCYVCGNVGDEDNMIVCSLCKYNVCHYYCDRLKEFPRDRWYCRDCKEELKEQKHRRKVIGRLFVN